MRLPLIWRPAPSAGVAPAVVTAPVGLVDLAPTFCAIAGVAPAGRGCRARRCRSTTPTPTRGLERVLTEWDSELFGVGVHLRTITRDGWVCTTYRPGYVHDGTEGELYDLADDPLQQHQPVGRPRVSRASAADLVADLWDHQPADHDPRLDVEAPV